MTVSFAGKGAHPVISAAGDRYELLGWYGHIPFPTPEVLAAKRAELLAQMEQDRSDKLVVLAPRGQVLVSTRKGRRTTPVPPTVAA